jgi:hypothetical protein
VFLHHLNIALLDWCLAHKLRSPLKTDVLGNGGHLSQIMVLIDQVGKVWLGETQVEFLGHPCLLVRILLILKFDSTIVQEIAKRCSSTTSVPIANSGNRFQVEVVSRLQSGNLSLLGGWFLEVDLSSVLG